MKGKCSTRSVPAQEFRLPSLVPRSLSLTLRPGNGRSLWFNQVHESHLQDTVQDLGPLGPAAFVASISICECIPFFPTQPLSIAAGLLFGAGGGAALNLLGLCTASTLAFTLSRTAFRGVAEAVVKAETGGEGGDEGKSNPVKEQIEKAQQLIESGGPAQQFTAILLLRLTPIVPFSASNYVLGLTPVPYPPFIGATIVGPLHSTAAPQHGPQHGPQHAPQHGRSTARPSPQHGRVQ